MRWFGRGGLRRGEPAAAGQGLFVIGTARSGTTILQNALNHSPDIFLLGEPDLHLDPGTPGFAARYEAMHRNWHNQPTKSTALPLVAGADGAWPEHLQALARHHRMVGTKIVVNPRRPDDWIDRLLRFQATHFYAAYHLFVFRDPVRVLASIQAFQRLGGAEVAAPERILRSIAETILLFTRMTRTMPNVRAVALEDLDAACFAGLAEWLGVRLQGAATYYEPGRMQPHDEALPAGKAAHALDLLVGLHADLRVMLRDGVDRPQLEQNRRNPSPDHLTAIGAIDNRAALIETYLRDDPGIAGQ